MSSQVYGLLFVFAGCFSMAGAYFNWDWFMKNSRAWLFVKLFGRNGARIVYGLLGAGLVTFGLTTLF
jgi:drug/metabolite transporter superfamily protein YnfA